MAKTGAGQGEAVQGVWQLCNATDFTDIRQIYRVTFVVIQLRSLKKKRKALNDCISITILSMPSSCRTQITSGFSQILGLLIKVCTLNELFVVINNGRTTCKHTDRQTHRNCNLRKKLNILLKITSYCWNDLIM